MSLSEKKCVPCRGGIPALTPQEVKPLLEEVNGWTVVDDFKLKQSFKFDNFKDAMNLANKIAEIAENEGHHPDLLVRWGELVVEIWTHKVNGLTESDFILAAKIDKIASI